MKASIQLDELLTEAVQVAAEVEGVSPEEWLMGAIQDALGKRLCDLELDRLNAQDGSLN